MRTHSETISVLSLNLRFGLADDGQNSWSSRKKSYPALLENHKPSFLCVQESNDFQTDFLRQTLPDFQCVGDWGPAPKTWQNNLIFGEEAWRLCHERHCFLTETPDRESKLEESRWPRQCTFALFQKDRRNLLVGTTHFDFLETVQETSARLMIGFLSDYDSDVPVVITGDFNAAPGSAAYGVFRDAGFNDAFEGRHSFTFHGFSGTDAGGHIDWILYRGNLECCDAEVITKSYLDIYPSDHFPVRADFTLS